MGKQALCVQRYNLDIDFNSMAVQAIPEVLYSLPAGLVDRDICETNSEFLQLIPYVVVRNKAGRVFCYERGVKGGEDRLHAKLSVGIGGHVEEAPSNALDLRAVLIYGAMREVEEEIGGEVGIDRFTGLIYTGATGNPVDQVHVGLLASVELNEAAGNEPGIIEKGRFMTMTELLLPANFDRLEPWSQAVVTRMKEQLSEELGALMSCFGEAIFSTSIESPTGITSVAAQEVGATLQAVGRNVTGGFALARVYEDDVLSVDLGSVGAKVSTALYLLGRL